MIATYGIENKYANLLVANEVTMDDLLCDKVIYRTPVRHDTGMPKSVTPYNVNGLPSLFPFQQIFLPGGTFPVVNTTSRLVFLLPRPI